MLLVYSVRMRNHHIITDSFQHVQIHLDAYMKKVRMNLRDVPTGPVPLARVTQVQSIDYILYSLALDWLAIE